MSIDKKFNSNFLVLFSGNVVSQIIPFIFAPFLARIFSPEDFAVQGNFLALTSLIAIIASGRYEIAIVLPKTIEKATNLAKLSMNLGLIISLLSISILLFKTQIAHFYKDTELTSFLFLIPIGIFLISYNSIYNQWLTRLKKYKEIATIKIVLTVSINVITITLGWFKFGISGLIYGWIIGTFINNIILGYIFRKTFDKTLINKNTIKEVAKEYKDFPIINSAHAFTDIFFSQFLLYAIITRGYGIIFLGLFYMMNKYLKAPIRLISGSVGQLYYREANDLIVQGKPGYPIFIQSLKTTLLFALPYLFAVLLFAPILFKWYLGEQWIESGEYAQIMAIPIFLSFLTSPVSSTSILYKKQKIAFIFSIIGYSLSTLALVIGILQGFDFKSSLLLLAVAQSIYYAGLLIWYTKLSSNSL